MSANNDLTRARRLLAQLKRRKSVCWRYAQLAENDIDGDDGYKLGREARRMAREYARKIAAQELECRRLALTGPWLVQYAIHQDDVAWYARFGCGVFLAYRGPNAKARAVAWAERQNAKARKDGGK